MEKFDEIYFSDHGLTSTSASHLADIAQEVVAADEAMLRNMTFVTATLDIVGVGLTQRQDSEYRL